MAVQRTGRVIFLDAPATENAIIGLNVTVYIDYVRVVSGVAGAAELELFGAQTAVAARKILHLATITAAAGVRAVDDAHFSSIDVPDSSNGLTAVLTGAGSVAFIYLA